MGAAALWHVQGGYACVYGLPARKRSAVDSPHHGGSGVACYHWHTSNMRRVLVLVVTLLGTAHAAAGADCAADGSSASYSETITTTQGVTKRTIVTNGCPNHESYCTGKPGPAPTCKDEGQQGSDTEAVEQDVSVDIPANPILKSSYEPGELDCSMGAIAYALNGIGFYSGAVGYDADGNCPQLDVADPEAEWISFDCCTGHSDYDAAYHYHFPPSCLLAQANKAAPVSDGHSAQVGWAEDGFPICPRPASAHAIDATRHSPPISAQTARSAPAASRSATAAPRARMRPTARTSAVATRVSSRASTTTSTATTLRAKSAT